MRTFQSGIESENHKPFMSRNHCQTICPAQAGSHQIQLRIVLLGRAGAGKSKVARFLLGGKQPKGEIRSCVVCEGETAGRRIWLVDTPGWGRSILHTREKIKNEVIRSVNFCPPGPHALIVVLRVEGLTEVPSVKQLNTASRHMELLSERAWKHTMVLFLCDNKVDDLTVEAYIQKANKLLEKCGNRHYVLHSEAQVSEFLQEIEKMVEGNSGDFFLPQIYYEYCQTRINEAEEAVIRCRRGNLEGLCHLMNEDNQTMDTVATKSKFLDRLLGQHYLKPVGLLALVIISALIGSIAESVYGVMGSCMGIVI
ncbi:hypothetical protein AOLI_G00003120 [Acnodon oligacanthus]